MAFGEKLVLAEHQFEAFIECPGGGVLPCFFPLNELPEDPWIGECCTADGNCMTAGFVQHAGSIGDVSDISISDHRNSLHSLHDCADAGQ